MLFICPFNKNNRHLTKIRPEKKTNKQSEKMRSLIPFRNWLKLSCHWFKFESSISKGTKQRLYSTFLMLLKPCPLFTTNVLLFVLNLVALLTGVRRVWRYQREVIRIRSSKTNIQHNGHKISDKQRSTKHTHTLSSNTNPSKNREWTQMLREGKLFLLNYWHPSC